ncbi:MAG TPA: hypothetical protein ENN66_02685 [Proteobacteria bacterium]|nr:hypothetical protein [Pseudomonadota bacterium]
MNRQRALDSKPELQIRLALFGSTTRDTASSVSDVDVLVTFDGPATSKRYFGIDDDTLWSNVIQDDVPELLPPRPPIDWTPELRSKFDQAMLT